MFTFPAVLAVALAAAAAPDCAKDRIVEGDSFDAVDAVVIAVFTNFWALPVTESSRFAKSSKPRSTLPQRPFKVDVTADDDDDPAEARTGRGRCCGCR